MGELCRGATAMTEGCAATAAKPSLTLIRLMPRTPSDLARQSEAAAGAQTQTAAAERACGLACAEAARRLWDYVDARLPETPVAELEAHLAICAACAGHVAFARVMRRALAATSALASPDERHAALRARVLTAMTEARR